MLAFPDIEVVKLRGPNTFKDECVVSQGGLGDESFFI